MLFAPALADRAILPTAWGSSYFFNRIGRFLSLARGTSRLKAGVHGSSILRIAGVPETRGDSDCSRYIASSRIIYALDGYLQRLVGLLCAVAPQYFPVHAHVQKRQAFWGV